MALKQPPPVQKVFRLTSVFALLGLGGLLTETQAQEKPGPPSPGAGPGGEVAQVPTWTAADMDFFLHGSMSTEFLPEIVLRAFIRTYPDLFPKDDLSHLGAIPDSAFGWPVGFSRREVPHLGGLSSIGVNCASCHVGEIIPPGGGASVRVLGGTSPLDVEGFFGTVLVSTFRTADPAHMKNFLAAYLASSDPKSGEDSQKRFQSEWQKQEAKITAAINASTSRNVTDGLRPLAREKLRLDGESLRQGVDLATLSVTMLDLFHNMRFAVHVPDVPPPASPPNGPGRNDPWRILSFSLLGVVTDPAPVKFGIVWDAGKRLWMHVDGNTRSPIIRNLAASLGLGAPLVGHRGLLDFAAVERHTALSQIIRPPRYPWGIDRAAAERGARTYAAKCASCHDGEEQDTRLFSVAEIQTDPNRAKVFTPSVAEGFNKFFTELEITGYQPPPAPIRSTGKYWSPSLGGVWARSPFLHNGSVRTMRELLDPPAARPKTFRRGSRTYDPVAMGFTNDGAYLFDTRGAGNANAGHDYGTTLPPEAKRDLLEFLKTL